MTGVINAPTLAAWEATPGYDDAYVNTIPNIKGTVATIEDPGTPAAEELVLGTSLCADVMDADKQPPPVDEAIWSAAMTDFLAASKSLHTGSDGYPAGGRAKADLTSGTMELNAFLTAIGK